MMMHLRIGSLLLLALGIHGAIVKRDAGPDLSGINSLRREIGGIAGVEMPALEWDEGLVKKAKKMPNDCDKLRHGSGYRFFLDAPDENAQKLLGAYYNFFLIAERVPKAPDIASIDKTTVEIRINRQITALEEGQENLSLYSYELFNPAQNKIGCARTKCTIEVEEIVLDIIKQPGMPKELQLSSNKATFSSVCVLGPSHKWAEDRRQNLKILRAFTKAEALKGGKISYEMSSVMASTGIISILSTSLFFVFLM